MENIQKLINGESFLKITRENETYLPKETTKISSMTISIHGTGLIEFIPDNHNDKSTILSCAIHGNETAPIEICDELITNIINGKQDLKCPTLFIFGNPKAMNIGKRFIDFNLNRLFTGNHKNIDDCYETERAIELEAVVEEFFSKYNYSFKRHYDLHTAIKPSKHEKFAIYPYCPDREKSIEQMNTMEALDANIILFSTSKATTFSYHTSSIYNSHSFTVELGKVHPFGKNPQESFIRTRESLSQLLSDQLIVSHELHENVVKYQVQLSLIKNSEKFAFHFPETTENFTLFKADELVYFDGEKDCTLGEDLRIVFPNQNVVIGQRAALFVKQEN